MKFCKQALSIVLAATLLSGCATFGAFLDGATDPRLLEIIKLLDDLMNRYHIALEDPSLEIAERAEVRMKCDALADDIEVQLQRLETLGYRFRAQHWRKKIYDGYHDYGNS